jgi:hypothetical protein
MEKNNSQKNIDCDFDKNVYDATHSCNKFLLRQEYKERNEGIENDSLYPTLNDPNFSLKIATKQEFNDTQYEGTIHDVEERANLLSNLEFELSPHQNFVKNYLSSHTPYNSLLLFHGLGTGKTCSAIGICEEHRDYIKQTNTNSKIIVVASPTVQDNFKLQLFNANILKSVNGEWLINNCIGNKLINEVNPTHTKNIPKEKLISKINKIINSSYEFMGYREFANYIEKKQTANVDFKKWSTNEQMSRMKRNLKLEFDSRFICIDEVHNIRNSDDNENKRIANQLTFLVKSASNMRLLFLSGTPMFDNYKEIIWLINIMNMNDRRGIIKISDVFDAKGNFRKAEKGEFETGRDVLIRKATGYVSFVRGENPYTFPYRIYPDLFSPENTFNNIPVPKENVIGGKLVENKIDTLTKHNLFVLKVGSYQSMIYNGIIKSHNSETADLGKEDNKLSYTKLQEPIQSLNISFPINNDYAGEQNIEDSLARGTVPIKQSIGTKGLKSVMDYVDDRTSDNMLKGMFQYKPWVQKSEHANFFTRENIGKYSSKMEHISDSIRKSKGVILIYSQYLDGGLIPMALVLESMGITRYGEKKKSLFKNPPVSPVDYKTMETIQKGKTSSAAKYAMITGDKRLSPNNINEIIHVTDDDNKDGKHIKVILISMAGSEGVDLKFIRQVHILEPWFNLSRPDQTIGRAVRNNSHRLLPYSERNVQIFMYATTLDNPEREAADVSVYRSAEYKALLVGNVTRLLKEISVDCFLNHSQTNFSIDIMKQQTRQSLADGTVLDKYAIGDRSFTMMTDFMQDGQYKCVNTKNITSIEDIDINKSTYDEKFIMINSQKITGKIKELFKQKYFYIKEDLITMINYPKSYPSTQIYSALTNLIENETEYLIDMYGRNGRLINIGDYYMFQPVELINPEISLFERSTPLQHKTQTIKIKMEIPTLIQQERLQKQTPNVVQYENDTIAIDNEKNEKTENTIIEMRDKYRQAMSYYQNTVVPKPKDNIYKHVGACLRKMKSTEFVQEFEDMSPDDILKHLLVFHLVDNLSMREKIDVFLAVFMNKGVKIDDDGEDKIIEKIEKYYTTYMIKSTNSINKSFSAFLFYDPSVKTNKDNGVFYVKYEGNDWKLAETEDKNDIQLYVNEQIKGTIAKSDVHKIFGFMSYGKTDVNVADYKVKDITNTRSTGYKCVDAANKTKKLALLRDILKQGYETPGEKEDEIEEILRSLKVDEKNKDFGMKELCIFVEFITRYYQHINKTNKYWFFTYERQTILREMLQSI